MIPIILALSIAGSDIPVAEGLPPNAAGSDWSTFESPDGRLTFDVPCAEADRDDRIAVRGFDIECRLADLPVAMIATKGIGQRMDPRPVLSFIEYLKVWGKDIKNGSSYLGVISGHRAIFTKECKKGAAFCSVVIEDSKNPPLNIGFPGSIVLVPHGGGVQDMNGQLKPIVLRALNSIRFK